MALTTTETLGFCESVSTFMQSNQTALQEAGLNVTPWIAALTSQKTDAATKNDEQEALKAQLRETTAATNEALKGAYDMASTRLDAIIGTLGKTSELAKQAARLRSDIRRGNAQPDVAAPKS